MHTPPTGFDALRTLAVARAQGAACSGSLAIITEDGADPLPSQAAV
jgi:hypothetical protein